MAAGKDGGIGREHAVDIGPDLDFFRADACAHDGRGEIGAAAAERRGDAFFGGGDEAAHHHHALVGQRRHDSSEACVVLRHRRFWCGRRSGDDHAAGIEMDGMQSKCRRLKVSMTDAESLFSVTGDGIDGARCQFAEHRETFHQFGQFAEMVVERAVEFGALGEGHHLPRFTGMEIAEIAFQVM